MQKMKRVLGLFLFWLSWILWTLMFVVPFVLDSDVETVAIVTTSVLVAAEVSFIVSLLLLGKPFYLAMKTRVKRLWLKFRGKNSVTEDE